jgi:hypothetical protein
MHQMFKDAFAIEDAFIKAGFPRGVFMNLWNQKR